jgi:general nucleoside transport system permease protein
MLIYRSGAFVLSLLFIAGIVLLVGASPLAVASSLWDGAFGTVDRFARVLANLSPLLLCASGLAFAFTTNLYNLGVEGQITFGAITTTFMLRLCQDHVHPVIAIALALGAGVGGGVLWGLLAGALNVFGKISEIFAGLGLNFAAQGLALYLVFGPWQRNGVASMSGTELFKESLWLPTFGQTEASPIALLLGAIALIVTTISIRGTYFGLSLRAVGLNPNAAYVLGIPITRRLLSTFGICGACAGLAGALQVLVVFHRLIPNISSNLGFLALLVVMLSGNSLLLIFLIAFCFSAINIGSLQLPLNLQIDSSLSGVIQGLLILFALIGQGLQHVPIIESLATKLTEKIYRRDAVNL